MGSPRTRTGIDYGNKESSTCCLMVENSVSGMCSDQQAECTLHKFYELPERPPNCPFHGPDTRRLYPGDGVPPGWRPIGWWSIEQRYTKMDNGMSERLEDHAEWSSITIKLPPELATYKPSLIRFFDAMVFKLRRNAHKGKWEDVPMARALGMLHKESEELQAAVDNGSTMEILMEGADVANQALIVAEIGLEVRGGE